MVGEENGKGKSQYEFKGSETDRGSCQEERVAEKIATHGSMALGDLEFWGERK